MMPALERSDVKSLVLKSLQSIADTPAGDIQTTPLNALNSDQKTILAKALVQNLAQVPYIMLDGTTDPSVHYGISLTKDIVNSWKTVGDCIDYITKNQYVTRNPVN